MRRFGFVPMQAKRTSRVRRIFIADTSIMTVRWLNWKLPARPLPNDARLFELKGYIERRRPGR